MLGRKPSFIKNEALPKVINNIEEPKRSRNPEYATYDEWQMRGFVVMKGEKSYRRENGVAVFHKDQVEEMKSNYGWGEEDNWWDLHF